MLNLTASKIARSEELPFSPAAPVTAVGQALVQNGTFVKPGTGGAGELFVGVALAQPLTLLNFPAVESLVANASGIVTLANTPIAGTLRVYAPDLTANLTVGTPASNTTEYSISGATITEHVSRAGKTTIAYYQFVPTTAQARLIQGDIQPGGAASLTTGTVGVIRAGTVFTSEYDPTVDWTTANPAIKVGANARFTIGGAGAAVPNAQVISAPTYSGSSGGGVASTTSLLGLYFSA